MKEGLEKIKIISIKGDSFTLDITKFSVDDFLAIEAEKQRLSTGKYYQIATTFFTNTLNAANLIDMVAVLRVLLPEIEKSIATQSFEKLNLMDSRELLLVYLSEIAPWYQAWMDEFNTPFKSKEEPDDELNDEK